MSIVVPVYGVEKYLEECVESLLAQTYDHLQIILVDDASPDRCGQLCDEYAQKDSRIKVIHKPNGGAASARNVGIDAATGEYICFVDADDVVDENHVKHLWMALTNENADVSVGGLYLFTKTQKTPISQEPLGVYTECDYLRQFTAHWTCALMTNKLFKRSVVGAVRFAEGHCIDDEFFTYRVIMNSKKIVVTDFLSYGYRMRVSSVMHGSAINGQRIILDRIEYLVLRYTNIKRQYPELKQVFFQDMLNSVVRFWFHSKDMPRAQKEIHRWCRRNMGRIVTCHIPLRSKLVCFYQLGFCKPRYVGEPDFFRGSGEDCFS